MPITISEFFDRERRRMTAPGHWVIALVIGGILVVNDNRVAVSRAIFGVGGNTCGAWVQARKENNTSMVGSWVLGYLAALNLWGVIGGARDALEGTDPNGLYQWLDNYCAANPLKSIAEASGHLARELNRRALPK
jgi:ABC-type xylose transport system permease subunit